MFIYIYVYLDSVVRKCKKSKFTAATYICIYLYATYVFKYTCIYVLRHMQVTLYYLQMCLKLV